MCKIESRRRPASYFLKSESSWYQPFRFFALEMQKFSTSFIEKIFEKYLLKKKKKGKKEKKEKKDLGKSWNIMEHHGSSWN